MTLSLVAVFIPLLLMGGVVGRLFREFAVTLRGRDSRLGARVADADADDVRAIAAARDPRQRRALRARSKRVQCPAARLRARSALWCWAIASHAWWSARDHGAHGRALRRHAEGFFPAAGHRADDRVYRGGAGRVVPGDGAMAAGDRAIAEGSGGRPVSLAFIGGGGGVDRATTAACSSAEADGGAESTRQVIAGCARSSRRSRASGCSCRRHRTCDRRPPEGTQYQYTLQAPIWTNSTLGAGCRELKKLPEFQDVATDQQTGGLQPSGGRSRQPPRGWASTLQRSTPRSTTRSASGRSPPSTRR